MPAQQTGPAKLYVTQRPDTPYQVVFRDPTKVEKSGRAKRVVKWFAHQPDAEQYRDEINEKLLAEGAAGVSFDAGMRADAINARRKLDAAGHWDVTLTHLAERYTMQVQNSTANLPIAPEIEAYLLEKETVDGAAPLTIVNLRVRLWRWVRLSGITSVQEISRQSVECLRTRAVGKQTRRNDMNAVSAFCTWLVSATPPKLDHHPLKGVKRPRVEHGAKPTFTADECRRIFENVPDRHVMATLAVMIFAGPRPSEVQHTRLIYGRTPMVRIEGGKLRGRANRILPMVPPLRAFLATCGNPERVAPLTRWHQERLCERAALQWAPDICRHTFISNRLQLVQNDGKVAREGGTSEGVIFRHYHALKTPAEARAWEKLRPAKALTEQRDNGKLAA